MPTRAIAPIVGAGNATVFRDIRAAGVSNETPEADPINDGDAQTSAISEPDAQGAPGSTSEDAADGATEVVATHTDTLTPGRALHTARVTAPFRFSGGRGPLSRASMCRRAYMPGPEIVGIMPF